MEERRQHAQVRQLAGRGAGPGPDRGNDPSGRRAPGLGSLVRGPDLLVDVALLAPPAAHFRRGWRFAAPDRLLGGVTALEFGLVGGRVIGRVGQAEAIGTERVRLAVEPGLDLLAQRSPASEGHSAPSGGLAFRQPVFVRRMPSGPGGPSTAPGGAERSSSAGRNS